eukprot:76182_1
MGNFDHSMQMEASYSFVQCNTVFQSFIYIANSTDSSSTIMSTCNQLFYTCILLFIEFQTTMRTYSLLRDNITFETSSLHLPQGLHGHLSTVYNDTELHLFGGYNTILFASDPRMPPMPVVMSSNLIYTIQSESADILNGTIITDEFSARPSWDYPDPILFPGLSTTASSISCVSTKCYDTINDTLYAFIPSASPPYNLFVYKYDMITKSFFTATNFSNTNYLHGIAPFPFIPYSYTHEYDDVVYHLRGCIVSDSSRYIYSFGTTRSSGSKYHGFEYDALLDVFTLREFDLVNRGYDMGCGIDHGGTIYIFGGKYSNDLGFTIELDLIEKWSIQRIIIGGRDPVGLPETVVIETSTVITETLQYSRSKCTVLRTKSNHFIIMDGTTYESKKHIEVFDANTDEMILLLSIDVDLSNMEAFTAFLFNDMLYINGGLSIAEFETDQQYFLYTNISEHVQKHRTLSNYTGTDNVTIETTDQNTVLKWETLGIYLPHALSDHISVVYNDTLHIIGGLLEGESASSFTYTSIDSFSDILDDRSNNTEIAGLNFEITSQIMPNWDHKDPLLKWNGAEPPDFNAAPSAIGCSHDCYTVFGDTLYVQLVNGVTVPWSDVFNPTDVENIFYVKYHFLSASYYLPEQSYYDNYVWTVGGENGFNDLGYWDIPWFYRDQCVIAKDARYIVSIGGYGDHNSHEALMFDTETVGGAWNYTDFEEAPGSAGYGFSELRRAAMACRWFDDALYIFGGRFRDGHETNLIVKVYGDTKYIVDAEMKYKRSYFKVSPVTIEEKVYFIIYGGTTELAKANIEIFDPFHDTMVTHDSSVDQNYNLINDYDLAIFDTSRTSYSSFIYNNHLIISGGLIENGNGTHTAVNDFKYLNLEKLFDVNYTYNQDPDYSCMHIYYTDGDDATNGWDNRIFIDEYIYDDVSQVMFESDPFNQLSAVEIDASPGAFRIEFNDYDLDCDCINILYTDAHMHGMYSDSIDLSSISNKEDVNMKWATWDSSVGVPYFRMGIGDQFEVSKWQMPSTTRYNPVLQTTSLLGLQIYGRDDLKWTFYSNQCRLDIDLFLIRETETDLQIVDSFAIGDILFFDWKLIRGDALYRSVSITSDDISNINHTMIVDEDGECMLTSLSSRTAFPCDYGIVISEVNTYDITKTYYEVLVTAQHEILSANVTVNERTYRFKRDIMEIGILLDTDDGIYGASHIHFEINQTQTIPTQPNGTVIITMDDALLVSDDNTILMDIHFDDDSCWIQFIRNHVSHSLTCSDPLVIPFDMTAKRIGDNNYTIFMSSNDMALSDQSKVHYVSRKIQTLALNISDIVYLGELIHFNVSIMDDIITQSSSQLIVKSTDLDVDVIIDIQYKHSAIDTCEIVSPSTGTTTPCHDGIPFNRFRRSMIGSTYQITIISSDTYLMQYTIPISIENCNIGFGLITITASNHSIPCTKCAVNSINIYPNSDCVDCNDVDGVQCSGASELQIAFNYWISFDTQTNQFISSYCPSGYCCLQETGCLYDISGDGHGLCSNNRNSSIPLCGGCNDGFVEVFGSTDCMECPHNHYEYLFLPICLALLYVIALTNFMNQTDGELNYFDSKTQEINYARFFFDDDLAAIKIAALRPMTYLFQGIAVITIQTGYAFYLQPLLDIFSMQFIMSNSSSASGICFTTSLNAISEEVWYLFYPFSMFIIILIYYVIYTKLKWFECKKFKPNFLFAFWQTFLICIGAVLSKMFKILACRKVGDDLTVHFYAGNLECYGYEWIICAISLFIIIIIWCRIWYYLLWLDPLKRASSKAHTQNLTQYYKEEYWYWEFVLMTRRILLAFIITFNYLSESFTQYILLSILVFYYYLHLKHQPFKHGRVNYFETLCLTLLILGLTALGFRLNTISPIFVALILTTIVLLPFLVFVYWIVKTIKRYRKHKLKNVTEQETARGLALSRLRMTPTQKQLVFGSVTSNSDLQGNVNTNEKETDAITSDNEMEIEGIAMTNMKTISLKPEEANEIEDDTIVNTILDELENETSSSEDIMAEALKIAEETNRNAGLDLNNTTANKTIDQDGHE